MDATRTFEPPATPTGLYWSERGEITCGEHAPYYRSDTWNWGRWTFMAVDDAEAWRDELGSLPRCETCGRTVDLPPF